MNDTPRTDAAEASSPDYATPEYIHSDFVRQLERELNEANADRLRLADALKLCSQVIGSPNEDPPKWPSIEDCNKAWHAAKSALETYRAKYPCTR